MDRRKLVIVMYENEKVIRFMDTEDIKEFVNAAGKCNFDIDVFYNRAVIDAKSILGMLGVGLKNEMTIRYGGENENFENVIDKFATA